MTDKVFPYLAQTQNGNVATVLFEEGDDAFVRRRDGKRSVYSVSSLTPLPTREDIAAKHAEAFGITTATKSLFAKAMLECADELKEAGL